MAPYVDDETDSFPESERREDFSPERSKSVLVVGTQRRESLFVMRSMHRAGYTVHAARCGGTSNYTERSRSCEWIEEFPALDGEHDDEWLARLESLAGRVRYVFPVGDEEIQFFDRHRERLPESMVFVMPPPDIISLCLDKTRLLPLVDELDIPCGRFEPAESGRGLSKVIDRVGLPCVVKPATELVTLAGAKAVILRTAEDVQRLDRTLPAGAPVIVQSFAAGPRHNVYFVASRGDLRQAAQVRIRRTDRLDGTGYAVDGDSIALSPALLEQSRKLIRRMNYHGAGCIQYLVDEDGRTLFLEINSRIGANSAIAGACGIDVPTQYLRTIEEDVPPAALITDARRRYAWTMGDVHGFSRARRKGALTPTSAARWLWQLLWTAVRADVHITWSWRDPLPTLTLIGSKLFRSPERPPRPRRIRQNAPAATSALSDATPVDSVDPATTSAG